MLFHLFVILLFCCGIFLVTVHCNYVNQILKCSCLPTILFGLKNFVRWIFMLKFSEKNRRAIKYFDAKICRCENSERVYKHLV